MVDKATKKKKARDAQWSKRSHQGINVKKSERHLKEQKGLQSRVEIKSKEK